MICSSCDMECPSTANFCHKCGQQLNLRQISNKVAGSVDKEKLLKKYFHRGYPYSALIICTSDCGSGCFKVLLCTLSLILGPSDQMSNLQILLLYFITASDCRSRCLRFLLCKVLVVSLIIDFLRKSLREEIFQAFFWQFYNQFFAHVSAGSNIQCSFRALYFGNCAQVTAGSNVLGSSSAFRYKF